MEEPTKEELMIMLRVVTQQRNAALDQIVLLAAKLEYLQAKEQP